MSQTTVTSMEPTAPIKDLDDDLKNLLRHINECCMKINEQQNLNCTFKKIEFLEKEGFYDK
uniref:Uncharacterized protein n=1 Tax=viral metagenome TaxID=1070528 RepID=A0A6C0LEE9_9ZZZZ